MGQPKLTENLDIVARSDLQITLLDGDLNIIQKLDDEPNDVGGLSAQQLKAKFDESGNTIKAYINDTLIPELLAADATEAERASQEALRQANETVRQEQEAVRQSQEAQRQAAEQLRAEAEAARAESEDARESVFLQSQLSRTQAFDAAQAERAQAFDAAQAEREARFSAGEDARNFWENFDPAKAYSPGNKVYYLGSSYVNLSPCSGVLPTDAACWLLIAKKGADSGEGLSQEEADLRYLQLTGGSLSGPLAVPDPLSDAHAASKGYVDSAVLSAKNYGVTSFNGRTGAVVPGTGDYSAAQVGAYTQAQCISAATRTALGISSAATPDTALLTLARRFAGAAHRVVFTASGTFSPTNYGLTTGSTLTVLCVGGGGGGGGGCGGLNSDGTSTAAGYAGNAAGLPENADYRRGGSGKGYGAGGGGGSGISGSRTGGNGGGGGGGGNVVLKTCSLTSTASIAVTVGKGGSGGTGGASSGTNTAGTAGGTSSFGSYVTAAGGTGGSGSGEGGSGGSDGGNGSSGSASHPGGGGGGGGGFLVNPDFGTAGEGGAGASISSGQLPRGGGTNSISLGPVTSGSGIVIVTW